MQMNFLPDAMTALPGLEHGAPGFGDDANAPLKDVAKIEALITKVAALFMGGY